MRYPRASRRLPSKVLAYPSAGFFAPLVASFQSSATLVALLPYGLRPMTCQLSASQSQDVPRSTPLTSWDPGTRPRLHPHTVPPPTRSKGYAKSRQVVGDWHDWVV
ncbi:hypothetical protein BDP81DRAFT_440704 [Colletotrichum phormii]|uniref:Uncharacterized protein n=1 Tax=Colletotrichum phormii TaxID=359342 RepID=A0AAI9ZEC2_9PEZI|nr:uncharacterized protein BDP81DRAFT_440704 [Colletotrichum phormii]KAK1622717.1 hypothetical protein BDP81DRAFT_440704 [Colletotrichum phormii]